MAGAQPYDVLNIRHDLKSPYLVQRYWDYDDVRVVLKADALQLVPLCQPLTMPLRPAMREMRREAISYLSLVTHRNFRITR